MIFKNAFGVIKARLRVLKFRKHIQKFKKNKTKKGFKLKLNLLKKLLYIIILSKNIYSLSRKTYYVVKRGNIVLMPNLVIKTLFIGTALKGTFRIIISFTPLSKNTKALIYSYKYNYEKYVLSFIPQITSNFKFLVKYKCIIQPLSLGILVFAFSPQKAMADEWPPKNPKDMARIVDMFCSLCESFGDYMGSYGKLQSTQEFVDKFKGT